MADRAYGWGPGDAPAPSRPVDPGPSTDSFGPPPDIIKQFVHYFYRHIR